MESPSMERRRLVHIFQFGDVSDGRNGFATDECYWVGGYVALIGSNLNWPSGLLSFQNPFWGAWATYKVEMLMGGIANGDIALRTLKCCRCKLLYGICKCHSPPVSNSPWAPSSPNPSPLSAASPPQLCRTNLNQQNPVRKTPSKPHKITQCRSPLHFLPYPRT